MRLPMRSRHREVLKRTKKLFSLDENLVQELDIYSASKNVSLFCLILSALNVMLQRYCGQEEIVMAIGVAENLICDSRLATTVGWIRSDLSSDPTISELLQGVQNALSVASTQKGLLLDESVTSFPRLTVFNQLLLAMSDVDSRLASSFQIVISVIRETNRLHGSLEYNEDFFDDALACRSMDHLRNILSKLVKSQPQLRLSHFDILEMEERRRILVDRNLVRHGYPEECIHECFEKQVAQNPSTIALVQKDLRVTYGELNGLANKLARELAALGVGPEIRVGLCMGRSIDAAIGVLGILKAGGVYVPLDPTYPIPHIHAMVKESQVSLIVTHSEHQGLLPSNPPVMCVDGCNVDILGMDSSNLKHIVTPDNAVSVLFTSGSMGKPKGVVEIHRCLTTRLGGPLPDFQPNDICAWNSSLNFGISTSRLLMPLACGLTVVVITDEQVKDTSQFIQALYDYEITSVFMVPDLLRQVVDIEFLRTPRLNRLRTIAVSGGSLTLETLQVINKVASHVRIVNLYGGTEIGTTAAMTSIAGGSAVDLVTIGSPVSNTSIFILDCWMNPVPVAVPGELFVSAKHLARGYVNRPDLTAERFIPDPFGMTCGGRLFRTGDLARYLPNGDIEFLGRTDRQVKVRGFRIELDEIECVLRQHTDVSEAAVTIEKSGSDCRLLAFVVVKVGLDLKVRNLRDYLLELLPDYMVPSGFVFLDVLPTTSNGKLNRVALSEFAFTRPNLSSIYEPPRNSIEAFVAAVWQDELRLNAIGRCDNFFELGGHSLQAARILFRVTETTDLRLTIGDFMEHPTVCELSILLSGIAGDEERDDQR